MSLLCFLLCFIVSILFFQTKLSAFQVVLCPSISIITALSHWDFLTCQSPPGKQLDQKRKLNQKPAELCICPGSLLNKEIENFTLNIFDLSRPNQLLLLISDVEITKQPTYRLWPQLCRIYRCAIVLWSHISRVCFHLPLKEQLNVTV